MFKVSQAKIEKREAKRRSLHKKVRFLIEYFLARCATTVILSLSPMSAFELARIAGRAVSIFMPRRRKIGMDNLDRVYGDSLSRREKRVIVDRVFENLVLVLVESLFAARLLHQGNLERHFDVQQLESRRDVMDHHNGAFFLTAHIGNWEICMRYFQLRGYDFYAVARPLLNPHLDRYIAQLRTPRKDALLDKIGALPAVQKIPKRRGVFVAFVVDQNAGSGGTFVDFLGVPASTTPAPLVLAKRRRCPVLIAGMVRTGPLRFRIEVTDVISAEELRRGDLVEMTQRMSDGLAKIVHRYPDQWMWTHRRWKSRPPETDVQEEGVNS